MKRNLLDIAQQKMLALLARREAKESDYYLTRADLKSPYFRWVPGVKIDTNRKN